MSEKPTKNSKNKGHRQPVEFVRHPDTGVAVDGLRCHKASGLYYRLAPQPDGKRSKAVYYAQRGLKGVAYLRHAVREHIAHLEGYDLPTTAFVPVTEPTYDDFGGETPLIATVDEKGLLVAGIRVPLKALYAWIHDQIGNPETRKDFAAAVGIPELAYLERLRPDTDSLTLQAVITRYLGKTPPLKRDTIGKLKMFWQEFSKSVGAEKVSEITTDHIRDYRDMVYSKRKSPTYVKHRFGLVKSALAYNLTEGEDAENLQRVLTHCKMLRNLKPAKMKASPISPADFKAILDKADKRTKAMMLLALNCGLYPIDVANMKKESIDLDAKTLQDHRAKTGILRVAVLWDRTVTAIREYWQSQPNDTEYVFLSGLGQPYGEFGRNRITKYFRRYRKLANVDESVTFDSIRDGTQSKAIEGGAQEIHVNIILGHKVGIADAYLKRNPQMVADACEAIEKHYFSGKKK